MHDEPIFGETYGDLFRAFARAYRDLGIPRLAEFDPCDLHDLPVEPPLIRAVLRAQADTLVRQAERTRRIDELPYDDWAYDASHGVVVALLDRIAARRAAGIPLPQPFRLPPTAI